MQPEQAQRQMRPQNPTIVATYNRRSARRGLKINPFLRPTTGAALMSPQKPIAQRMTLSFTSVLNSGTRPTLECLYDHIIEDNNAVERVEEMEIL